MAHVIAPESCCRTGQQSGHFWKQRGRSRICFGLDRLHQHVLGFEPIHERYVLDPLPACRTASCRMSRTGGPEGSHATSTTSTLQQLKTATDACFKMGIPTVLSSSNPGCMDATACNYDADALTDDGTCTFPANEHVDCDGNCLADADADGICDGQEIAGCTDATACNYMLRCHRRRRFLLLLLCRRDLQQRGLQPRAGDRGRWTACRA